MFKFWRKNSNIYFYILFVALSFQISASADSQLADIPAYHFPPELTQNDRQEIIKIVQTLMDYARIKLDEKKPTVAIDMLKVALQIMPNDYRPVQLLAETYLRFGQTESFWETVEKATLYYGDMNSLFEGIENLYEQIKPYHQERGQPFLAPFKNNRKAAFSFMFDDGESSVVSDMIPVFEEFEMTATIPINPGHTFDGNENKWRGRWQEWRDAEQSGFEISNHAMNHVSLVGVSEQLLESEINGGYDRIHEQIGLEPYSFVFPFNKYDEPAIHKALERHRALRYPALLRQLWSRTFVPIYGGDQLSLETVRQQVDFAIRERFWIIPVCHGVTSEKIVKSYKPLARDFLKGLLQYLKTNSEEVWVDTFENVHRYLSARNRTEMVVHQQSENNIQLMLEGNVEPGDPSELAVVIPLKNKVQSVSAQVVESRQDVVISLEDNEIWLNIPIGGGTVEVKWESKEK